MNVNNPIAVLLASLSASSTTVATAFYQGRVYKTDENGREIERLRHLRLLSPDIRDAYQLRGSFRAFLNSALNTERLFSMGADIGGQFQQLSKLVDEHSIAFQEGRDSDCERYEVEVRETIGSISDSIEDELIMLQAQASTRFAAVSTIAEKRRQNEHYLKRTQRIVDILENLHFSDLGEQLEGHEDLHLSFRSLLTDRLPAFRQSFLSIMEVLQKYLYEFRQVEQRAKLVRLFDLLFTRNPSWTPRQWDEVADPAEWLRCSASIKMHAHPDIDASGTDEYFADIAKTIPDSISFKTKSTRVRGYVEDDPGNEDIEMPTSPLRLAIGAFYTEASQSEGISACAWWLANPSLIAGIPEDIWLLRVLAEDDNKGGDGRWLLEMKSAPHPEFSGNLLIHDAIVKKSPKAVVHA